MNDIVVFMIFRDLSLYKLRFLLGEAVGVKLIAEGAPKSDIRLCVITRTL